MTLAPNLTAARAFLQRFDPEAEFYTFQTFDDDQQRKCKSLARIVHADPANGALDTLAKLNQAQRAGIFYTINETDRKGRTAKNIQRVRAVFVDLDGAPLPPVLAAGLEPHAVVESSPGKWHVYWQVDDCPLDQFERVQLALARRFNGDPSVHDLPRVLRVPGFLHRKGEPFLVHTLDGIGTTAPPYTLAEIVGGLGLELEAQEPGRTASNGDTDTELRGHVINGDPGQVYPAMLSLAARYIGRGMAAADAIAALQGMLDAAAWRERDPATWQARRADAVELVESAAKKFGDRRERDTRDDRQADDTEIPGDNSDPPPVDLLRPMAAPPLRVADVPEVLGQFAAAHAGATGFDVSILLTAGIGAACAMLSDEVRLCVGPRSGWFESGRLWLVAIGGPGTGKTPATKAAMAPVYALHRERWSAWCKENEGVEEPEPPPALYTSDSTTEALAELLRSNERGLLYCVDELESWLASHDAYRSGAGKDRGEWLRLFDGGPHQVHRIKRGAFFVPNWGASLLSATTPAALRKLAPRLPDDGLLQRLLLVLARPRELPDDTMLRGETRRPSAAWDAALRRLYEAPAAVVQMSGEARAAFETEQAELHRLTLAFEDAHPPYAAHLAKRAAMLARLALVFHALEAPAVTDNLAGATMLRAVRFMRRQERHAQAVYGSMLGADTGMALAKAAARSILAAGLQSFNRRELAHRCKAFRGADEPTRQAALSLLCDCAWLTSDLATVTHGAHWTVDPRVHTLFADHGEAAKRQRETIRSRMSADEADE